MKKVYTTINNRFHVLYLDEHLYYASGDGYRKRHFVSVELDVTDLKFGKASRPTILKSYLVRVGKTSRYPHNIDCRCLSNDGENYSFRHYREIPSTCTAIEQAVDDYIKRDCVHDDDDEYEDDERDTNVCIENKRYSEDILEDANDEYHKRLDFACEERAERFNRKR